MSRRLKDKVAVVLGAMHARDCRRLRNRDLSRKHRVGPDNLLARQLIGYTALQLIVNLPGAIDPVALA
jgi:hypothetical protein